MRRSGKGSGGGIGMNKNVRPSALATQPKTHRVSVAATDQLGRMLGNHSTEGERTRSAKKSLHQGPGFQPVKYGNEVALNVGGGGPGKGRQVYRSGQQCTHGATNPGNAPSSGDVLEGWKR
jgi:hypothetical protein